MPLTKSESSGRKRKINSNDSEEVLGVPDEEELKYLEKIILGTGTEIFEKSESEDSDEEKPVKRKKNVEGEPRKPAWIDEDDNCTFDEVVKKQGRRCKPGVSGSKKYQEIMEKKYKEIMGVPKWAALESKNDNPVDELLRKCGKIIKKSKFLEKGFVELKKVKTLNCQTKLEGPFINVVKFHTKSSVALVAGCSGFASIVQVDGKQNTKLQSIQFHRFPIFCGSFLKNEEEFLLGSRDHKYFYCHDLMTGKSMKINTFKTSGITNTKKFYVSPADDLIAVCGKSGKIYLFEVRSKEYVDSLQMNCDVTALEFNSDGTHLFSHGKDGEVYEWDLKSRTCIQKFYDDGCLSGTSLAMSSNNQFLACGSSSGIVNVYHSPSASLNSPKNPLKTFYNLVTPVTSVKFNSSSEILAIASDFKENAIKLIHCPSMTVFSNFPIMQSKIKKPICVDFSKNSGYFAIGDNNGTAHLYRLKYYGNY